MNVRRATAVLVLAGATAAAADWPQWLGPRRDGGSAEVVAPWKDAPKEVWKAKVGIGFSSPVVANGRVFLHARVNGKEREVMTAFDAATGKEVWKTPYDRAPYSSVLNTGPQATPAVSGGRVYGYGITGVLTCFDAATGKQVWQTDILKVSKADVPRFGVCCSPLVVGTGDGNLLVLDDAGNLKLIDATAGEYRELASARACEATLVAPALANGHVFARDGDTLRCLKLAP